MIITRVTATAIKGRNFNYALAPAQAIIGDNFTGKTAIIEAIRLCLMGYLPEVGKLPKATWELSSAERMTVRLDFDDKSELTREFWLEGGTVKTTAHRIFKVGVPEQLESLPLLHAERYFGMTDTERTNYVFECIKLPDTYTSEAIIAEVERLSFEEKHTEQIEKAKSRLVMKVRECFESPAVQAGDPELSRDKPTIQQSLTIAVEMCKTVFTHWNKRSKDTQGAVTTLTELKLRESEVVTAAHGVKDRLKSVQVELDDLNVQKGKLAAQQDEAERALARKAVLKAQLGADRIDYVRMISKLRQKTLTLLPELDLKERVALLGDIKRAKDHRAEVASQVSEQERLLSRTTEEKKQLAKMTACPYCHSTGENWRATLAKELDATLTKAAKASRDARELLASLDKALVRMEAVISDDDDNQRKNGKLRLQQAETTNEIQRLSSASDGEHLVRKMWQEELDDLTKLAAGKDLTEEIQRLERTMADLILDRERMKASLDAETKLQQDLKRASQAQLEHLNAAAHVTVIKAVGKLLAARREAMIEDVFNSLLVVANKVTGGILKAQLALHDNTVGMWNGAKFIPHRVFSGTERAICYIAVAVALSAQAPLKLVILDEFGRLDERNQVLVGQRLLQCITDGVIDQFVVVGTGMPKAMPEGIRVIKL